MKFAEGGGGPTNYNHGEYPRGAPRELISKRSRTYFFVVAKDTRSARWVLENQFSRCWNHFYNPLVVTQRRWYTTAFCRPAQWLTIIALARHSFRGRRKLTKSHQLRLSRWCENPKISFSCIYSMPTRLHFHDSLVSALSFVYIRLIRVIS